MRAIVLFSACLAIASADIGLKLRQAAAARGAVDGAVGFPSSGFSGAVSGAGAAPSVGGQYDAGFQAGLVAGRAALASANAGASPFSGSGAGPRFGGAGPSNAGASPFSGSGAGPRFGGAGPSNAGASPFSGSGASPRFGGAGPSAFGGAAPFGSPAGFGGASPAAQPSGGDKVRYITKPEIVKKHFYYHVAPEPEAKAAPESLVEITPQTHYKVLFIKSPSVPAADAARAAARTRTQEKTIVYVLVNKPEAAPKSPADGAIDTYASAKPEVYFIKYQGKNGAGAGAAPGAGAGPGAFGGPSSDAFGGPSSNAFGGPSSNAFGGPSPNAFGGPSSGAFGGAPGGSNFDFGNGGTTFGGTPTFLSGANAPASRGAFDVSPDAVDASSVGNAGYTAGYTAGAAAAGAAAATGSTPAYDNAAFGRSTTANSLNF